ncbi:MAG: DNA-3-methyladenine glycosylase I [Proteobacteria bacterium]|nr:DNA-3-methyladenine glycosylase I [Pseudomonadota bacterium]
MEDAGLSVGADGRARCRWCASAADYQAYHDQEWGYAVSDDRRLFEKLCLEGFQAGLSWLTILRKREAFRRVFLDFDFARVARFGPTEVEALLQDAAIVRHRGKIEATINNARRACDLVDERGSLAAFIWAFEPDPAARPERLTWPLLRSISSSKESKALARELKRRGWRFVGPTTVYAFMQAMGLVNDHLDGCAFRPPAADARAALPALRTREAT